MSDSENQEQLLRLMRYHSTMASKGVSLDEYVKSMKEGQKKIYYIAGVQPKDVAGNPFMSPFKDSDVPVLIVANQIDEMVF
jgi:HSP90 family molecular chaperone